AVPRSANCLMCFASELIGLRPPPEGISWSAVSGLSFRSQQQPHQQKADASLDVKARLGTDRVLDATVHPDFSEVEIDTATLTGNRQFAVYLPEKRPFFLESVDLLNSPIKALYTRSITSPTWGVRLTDHSSNSEYALLTAK